MEKKKVVVHGMEYNITRERGSVRLTRCDPTGLVVENVFASGPESAALMRVFKAHVAALVLEDMQKS